MLAPLLEESDSLKRERERGKTRRGRERANCQTILELWEKLLVEKIENADGRDIFSLFSISCDC